MNKIKLILMIFTLFLFGCDLTMDSYTSREAELSALLDGDDAFGVEGFDDNGATYDYEEGLENNMNAKLLEIFHPDSGYTYKFGRKINSVTKIVTYTHEEDFSIAAIERTVAGIFITNIINSSTLDTNTFNKDFIFDFHRQVRFSNEMGSDNRKRWRIDALTLGIGKTGTKMDIRKLEYFIPDEVGDWSSVFVFDSETNVDEFISRDSLPSFNSWSQVKVELTVTNEGPEFEYESGERISFHYGRSRIHKARKKMYDDGEGEDLVAHDNIFTKVWTIHGPGWGYDKRVYRGFFSVIDYGSLFDSDEVFHSAVWALPYIVNR